jgi:signal transduction histidine kinase
VDLGSTLAAVAQLIEPTARVHSVAVQVEPVAGEIRVRVNEAELQQVLLNLSLNAVQACGKGGRVVLTAAGEDPVRIRVADDGCGIPTEIRKRIFEPFFSARRGGTGLGLFLSLDFVRHWGGDIEVRSAPGSGSTFEVVLPAAGGDSPVRVIQ